MEKENSINESDFSKNEIPDLKYLKPFEFEPKTNIEDINSSSSDDEEEGIEDKVKQIGNSKWCECSKQCKLMKTYTESLCCQEGNDIPEQNFEGCASRNKEYSSEVFQTPLAVPHFSKVAGRKLKVCNLTKTSLFHRCFL